MKPEPKGMVGQLWGVKVLPETQDEWIELVEQEKQQAVRELAEKVKDLMSSRFTKDTTHFMPKEGFVTNFNLEIDQLLEESENSHE